MKRKVASGHYSPRPNPFGSNAVEVTVYSVLPATSTGLPPLEPDAKSPFKRAAGEGPPFRPLQPLGETPSITQARQLKPS